MARVIFQIPDEMLEEAESYIKRRDPEKGDVSKICRSALALWIKIQKEVAA